MGEACSGSAANESGYTETSRCCCSREIPVSRHLFPRRVRGAITLVISNCQSAGILASSPVALYCSPIKDSYMKQLTTSNRSAMEDHGGPWSTMEHHGAPPEGDHPLLGDSTTSPVPFSIPVVF